jgi:hypothetical protein
MSQEEEIRRVRELYAQGLKDGAQLSKEFATPQDGSARKAKKTLSDSQWVQLAGFSNVSNYDDTESDLWDAMIRATTREEARTILVKAYSRTASKLKLASEAKNWWPSTAWMDAIRKFALTPQREPCFADLMEGLNITEFFKLSQRDLVFAQSEEKAQDETTHTRTISESRQLKNKVVRPPPQRNSMK